MGKWSQRRRHGGGGGNSGSLYPPILERDWDAFDGPPEGANEFQVVRYPTSPTPQGATTLVVRYREPGFELPWEQSLVPNIGSTLVDSGQTGVDLEVQAAWFAGATQKSDWSAGVAHVVTNG